MPAARGDALATVAFSASLTRPSVEQAAHHVRAVGVAMSETHQHVVAHLGDEHEAAVGGHAPAAPAVGRHHAYPARAHAARLPVHLHLHAALAAGVGVAYHPGHLRFGNRPAHVAEGKAAGNRGNGAEAVAVETVVAYVVGHVDDEELAHRGVHHAAEALAERTGEPHHAAHRQPDAPRGTLDVVRLGRLRLLLLLHVKLHLLHVVDARVGVLQRGFPEQLHRGAEGLVPQLVKPRGSVGRGLGHAAVVLRDVREHLGGARKRLHPRLEGDEVALELQPHRIGKPGLAEDQARAVVVKPFLVLPGKAADEVEVRLVVLADVAHGVAVLGVGQQPHARLGAQLPNDVGQRPVEPRVAVLAVLKQVGGGEARHAQAAPVEALLAGAHLGHHAEEERVAALPFVGEQALAQPFGAVLEPFDVPRARGVEVKQEFEAVVVVDGLVKFERLERVQPLAVDADGDVVVQCQHVVIAFRLWVWVLRMRRSAAAQVRG